MKQEQWIGDLDSIKCVKHNQKVLLFSLEEETKLEERLICETCLETIDTLPKSLTWQKIKQIFEKQYQLLQAQFYDERNQISKSIMSFKNTVNEIKTKLVQTLLDINKFATQWVSHLDQLSSGGVQGNQKFFLEEVARTGDLSCLESCLRQGEEFKLMEEYNLKFRCQIKGSVQKLLSFCSIIKLQDILPGILFRQDKEKSESKQKQFEQISNENLLNQLLELGKYITMAHQAFEKYLNETIFNFPLTQIKDIEPQSVKKIKQEEDCQEIKYELVDQIKQENWCGALVFNHEGTIMAAGCKNDIKIWNIKNGRLIETGIILKGHSSNIRCLVFSKKINWFASSGYDKSIRCWKEINQNNWLSLYNGKCHIESILCLLLDKNETELISSGADNLIKVWKVECDQNPLTYNYSLNKHKDSVCCICLNESETSLVSCSFDKSIIIWGKEQSEKWEFKYYIIKDIGYFGQRISFINDNKIAWPQFSQGITHIFELNNGVYQERLDLQLLLNQVGNDGHCLFPSIYNRNRKILIQKHNKYIYIIREQINGKLKILSQPIDCISGNNHGSLTPCGQFLVIWNSEAKQFRSYKINYK